MHLKGTHWAGTPPPDSQEVKAPNYYMKPLHFMHDDNSDRCVYNFLRAGELKNLINNFEAGTFTKWKGFRGIGFEKKYSRAHNRIQDPDKYTFDKLKIAGDALLARLKATEKGNRIIKMYYIPGIGVCFNIKRASMICYRTLQSGDSVDLRETFTKSCGCEAVLGIGYWGVVNSEIKTESLVTEIVYPRENSHNHSLDEFSISASDTFPKLKAFIEKCVDSGMGHHNTFVQVRKFAKETLVPSFQKSIQKKIGSGDTRFFPTRRTVYTYWLKYAGGSVKACQDQDKIRELLQNECSAESGSRELY